MMKLKNRKSWRAAVIGWNGSIHGWYRKATAKASYHTNNAKLAIASGGMSGEGYLQELRTILTCALYVFGFDFVQIAEEYGFIGSSVLLLLYFILIHRIILISLESRDKAGPFLIIGIVAIFAVSNL